MSLRRDVDHGAHGALAGCSCLALKPAPSGDGSVVEHVEITAALSPPLELPASFGEDANGELYVVMIGGNVYRIDPG